MQTGFLKTEKRRALQPLWNTFDEHLKPHENGGLLLAVSGGPDSLALLESFVRWPNRGLCPAGVLTLDHGARVEGRAEAERVAGRARALGLLAVSDRFCGDGTNAGEGRLRSWRFERFAHHAESLGLGSVVLAHHQDDEAEGFLMDLLGVGGGPDGASMVRVGHVNGLRVIRPFLGLRKNQLRLALSAVGMSGLAAVDRLDLQNQNWRAFVRHEVLSGLQAVHPQIVDRLASKGTQKRELADAVQEAADALWTLDASGQVRVALEGSPLGLIRLAVQRSLAHLVPQRDLRSSRRTLEAILRDIRAKSPKTGSFYDFSGVKARLESDQLILQRD